VIPLSTSLASGYTLLQALQVIFDAQARDVWSRFRLNEDIPDTRAWIPAVARIAQPVFLRYFQEGIVRQRQKRPLPLPQKKQLSLAFDLFNPKVLDAVDQAVLQFCQETNDTATLAAEEAREEVRRLLKEGLPQGDAYSFMASKIREIYADPYRAFRIATTETSRAMHGGQLLAMKEEPLITAKQWLAAADACPICQELDGEEKPLDEPFLVKPGRGPYRTIQTPPAHPFCFCTMNEVL
jgi:hypothetical protein